MNPYIKKEMLEDALEIVEDWGRMVTFHARKGETPLTWEKACLVGNPVITETIDVGGLKKSVTLDVKFVVHDAPPEWEPVDEWQGRNFTFDGRVYRIQSCMKRLDYPWASVTAHDPSE